MVSRAEAAIINNASHVDVGTSSMAQKGAPNVARFGRAVQNATKTNAFNVQRITK